MNSQDWYLDKLDITQYVLRKPNALKGEAQVNIAENTRLIVVSKHHPVEKIFQDILRAIHLTTDDCLCLTPSQLIMPIEQLNHVVWFIDEDLPETWLSSDTWQKKPIIQTSSLVDLSQSPTKKRQLWQQLCQYEHYFQSNGE